LQFYAMFGKSYKYIFSFNQLTDRIYYNKNKLKKNMYISID